MNSLIRDAPLGQVIRWVTKKKYFKYPEEEADFVFPPEYLQGLARLGVPGIKAPPGSRPQQSEQSSSIFHNQHADQDPEKLLDKPIPDDKSEADTLPPDFVIVDWYGPDDPANPQNWTQTKKAFVGLIIFLYTFIVYAGSAIYVSSEEGIMAEFGVSTTASALGLSLYVLGYGVGPLFFSPLSEVPSIGRSPVYCITMFLFVIISIPLPLVHNFGGLLVLRFLQGFFGSPCLATGGATMQDIYSLLYLPFALSAWVTAAYCGPALGPLISGFAVSAMGWRWSLWEILWGAGPVFGLMFLLLPETSTPTLLHQRARRLRKLIGSNHLKSQSEIVQAQLKPSAIIIDAIIKPIEITVKDPAILFVQVYTAIVYGIYYSVRSLPLPLPLSLPSQTITNSALKSSSKSSPSSTRPSTTSPSAPSASSSSASSSPAS